MARVRCESCGGVYRTIQRDGTTYFHVCGPIVLVAGRDDAGPLEERPLAEYRGAVIVPDQAAKDALIADGVPSAAIIVETSRRSAPRPDRRDENTLRREGEGGRDRVVRREGRGATVLQSDADVAREDQDGA